MDKIKVSQVIVVEGKYDAIKLDSFVDGLIIPVNGFSIFKDDDSFNVPIIIDSPLAIRLLHCYSDLLEGKAKEKFDEMVHWDNFEFIYNPEDSKDAVADKRAKVVLSSSGMLTAGRSVKWVQSILPNENDCILFCGYSTEGSLADKIKNGNAQKTININGKPYKNKANIISLNSFSGHMNRNDMLEYYSEKRKTILNYKGKSAVDKEKVKLYESILLEYILLLNVLNFLNP